MALILASFVVRCPACWLQAAQSALESGVDRTHASLVGHAGKYRECGMECVDAVGQYFKQDVQLFGIELPSRD